MTDPLIGTHLDEYLLEDLLGHGGMARVYRGLDTGLERYAAIKVIDTPYQQDKDYIARFEKEARAIAQLDHPHIVTVYRYGDSGQLLYLAMKYVEGVDLNAVLSGYEADKQFMPDKEVMRLLREIGLALDYAHGQGVIHRDIKPSNIMLDPHGRSYLTDFGLALLTEVGTQGEILGSPQYIAPEQAVSSAGAVAQSDLYALGVILYRMVTGTIPFNDPDILELLMMHMTLPPPSPRTIRPEISPAVEEVLLKALAKEPTDRFQSGSALADAYEEVLTNETAVPLAAAAPTLTIMDRVALDMEALPPLPNEASLLATEEIPPVPTSVTEQSEVITHEETSDGRKVWPIAAVVGLLLLLCLAFFLLRGRLGDDETVAAVTVPETATPKNELESDGGEEMVSETAVSLQTPKAEIESISLLPDTPSASADDVFMPIITNLGRQNTPNATEATATSLPPATEAITPDTPVPTNSPIPPTEPALAIAYQLLIAMHNEDSLFVVNQSAEAFPLARLSLGNDDGTIQGTEWRIAQLIPGNCVTAWKDGGKPKSPDVKCNQVGERLERKKAERFWKKKFIVFYDGEPIAECNSKKPCSIEIPKSQ